MAKSNYSVNVVALLLVFTLLISIDIVRVNGDNPADESGTPVEFPRKLLEATHHCGWWTHTHFGWRRCLSFFGDRRCRASCRSSGAVTGECKWRAIGCSCYFGSC
ncbi:uncharacterized protein [Spinacia oleracea]|uniref:Knottin scorpion toxin-like domain-containing protein n=1 Tax=Spinacia oleracea TaxID=3562 RepID=A0A9R0J8E6_SPIOL|nr:uncharacterized protein LOC110800883 [Spinacia oleracea]